MSDEVTKRVQDAIFAFSIGDDDQAYRALSEISLSLGKLDQAEESCRNALLIDPDDLTAVVSLARILVKKGDKEGAESASAKARLLGWKEELAEE
jgi:Flp pilus assembly protein TadD